MRVFTEQFEGGTNGATLTTATTAFTSILRTPSFTPGFVGSLGMRAAHAAGAADPMGQWLTGSQSESYIRFYLYRETATECYPVRLLVDSPLAVRALLRCTATGQVRGMTASYGSVTPVPTVTIPVGQWARVEWRVSQTVQRVRLFVGSNVHGATPDYDSGDTSWTATGQWNRHEFGNTNGTVDTAVQLDSIAIDNATWPGPEVASNQPPTVTLPADTTVEGWGTLGITATGTDPDGTIASWAWTATAGTLTGTGATRTWTAPAPALTDQTATVTATATDNGGQTGQDSMSITVPAATEAVRVAGAWAPARFYTRQGGAWV